MSVKYLVSAAAALSVMVFTSVSASAQDGLHFARLANWADIGHDTCITRATRSIGTVNAEFGHSASLAVTDGWLVGGNSTDANLTIACISDNDSLQLDSQYALRVLVLITVSTADQREAFQLRDRMRDCFFSGECDASTADAQPIFAPEVNEVQQARDPRTFGRRRAPVEQATNINWIANAVDYREQTGTEFQFICPTLGLPNFPRVWGTDVYTTDSSICAAAVHAGMITNAGGRVGIQIIDGRPAYEASESNGVTSLSYGAWSSSFRFIEAAPAPEGEAAPAATAGGADPLEGLEIDTEIGEEFQLDLTPSPTLDLEETE